MGKHLKFRWMLMAEVICALMFFAVTLAAFTSLLEYAMKAEAMAVAENRAILVLDNTLERIAVAGDDLSRERVNAIFMDEYHKSGLDGTDIVKPSREFRGGKAILLFKNRRKRTIAEVKVDL